MKSYLNFGRVVPRLIGKNTHISGEEKERVQRGRFIAVLQPAWYNGRRLNDFYFCKYDGIRYLLEDSIRKLIYRAKHRRIYLTYHNIRLDVKFKGVTL